MAKKLKRPAMDGSAGELLRCCQGVNKNKLYARNDPCEDDTLKLVLTNGECECVECVENSDCWHRSYSSCYVCVDGQCERGPTCCANTPGSLYAPCNVDPATTDPEEDCCVNFRNIHIWEAPSADVSFFGKVGEDYVCQTDTTGPRRFYTQKYDCEKFVIEEEVVEVAGKEGESCGCPSSTYTYTKNNLWIRSPSGSLRPSRRWCTYRATVITEALENKYGPQNGPFYGGGNCWANCSSPIFWIVGTIISQAPFSTSFSCTKGMKPFEEAGEESPCLGTQWPQNRACNCTGPAYALAANGDITWLSAPVCGVCAGELEWANCSAAPLGTN